VNKDIVIVDHISKISYKEVTSEWMEDFNKKIKNLRKYRGKIERRKEKISRLYE
jgi:histidinol phosphatase-like PHP family hydrolase